MSLDAKRLLMARMKGQHAGSHRAMKASPAGGRRIRAQLRRRAKATRCGNPVKKGAKNRTDACHDVTQCGADRAPAAAWRATAGDTLTI